MIFCCDIILIKNMGGTTNYEVKNHLNSKQSSGVTGGPSLTIREFMEGYQHFVDSLLPRATIKDLSFLTNSEILFLESSRYYQRLSKKQSWRDKLASNILRNFQFYSHNSFYRPLINEITQEIKSMAQFKSKTIIFGRVRHLLVLGLNGSLYRFTFQVGVGNVKDITSIQEETEDRPTVNFFSLYLGVSLVNVKGNSLADEVLDNVETFLSKHKVELSDYLKSKFRLLHDDDQDAVRKYNQLKDDKNQNGLAAVGALGTAAKIGKTAVTVFKVLGPIMAVLQKLLQLNPSQVQQGAQLNTQFSTRWSQEKPDTYASPLWRVGQIIASYSKRVQGSEQDINTTVTFIGTVIDSYAILTSANALLRKQREDPSSKMVSLQIRLPREAHTRKISIKNFKLEAKENSHFFLFLQQPLVEDFINYYNFELKYIKDPSTSYNVSSNKIYMCGYLNNGSQFHQSSRPIVFDQYYLVEGFRKNEVFIGAPIYYFTEDDNGYTYNLIGLNHATMSIDDSKVNDQTPSDHIASELIQAKWFKQAYYYKSKMAEAQFKYKAAQMKEQINSQQKVPLQNQSLMDQVLNNEINLHSPLHSVGIIEIKNNFQTSYAVGILFKQNQLLTLTKYTGDKSKTLTVYIKKFAPLQKLNSSSARILNYNLQYTRDFDIYGVVGQKTSSDKNLSILELKVVGGRSVVQNYTRLINKQTLHYFQSISAVSIGINKSASRGQKIVLAMDANLFPHQILQTYTDDQYGNYSVDGGLMFARDDQQVQYCYGFYEMPMTGDRRDSKGTFTFFETTKANVTEAISIRDNRNKIGETIRKEKPYSYTAILMSLFQKADNLSIGTCSLLRSKRQKVFVITCAHNLVFSKLSKDNNVVYTMEKQLKDIRLVFDSTKEITWNQKDIFGTFDKASDKMVKKVHIHPKYITSIRENFKKTSFTQDQGRYKPQYFYDIAVLEIDLPENNEQEDDDVPGFVIKKSGYSINKNNIKGVEVAGYPTAENQYGSRFGILYSEAVKDHNQQNHNNCYKIVTRGKNAIIQHKLSTLSGNSGSPVFIPSNDMHVLLGIHIAGIYRTEQVFNLATYINNKEVYDWLVNDVKIQDALIE